MVSGVASMVPGAGTVASISIEAGLLARDRAILEQLEAKCNKKNEEISRE